MVENVDPAHAHTKPTFELYSRLHVCGANMDKSQSSPPESSAYNVSVTVNNGLASSVGCLGGGRQSVTITALPPGVRPPFNPTAPTPHAQPARSGAVIVQPAARSTQIGQVSV